MNAGNRLLTQTAAIAAIKLKVVDCYSTTTAIGLSNHINLHKASNAQRTAEMRADPFLNKAVNNSGESQY